MEAGANGGAGESVGAGAGNKDRTSAAAWEEAEVRPTPESGMAHSANVWAGAVDGAGVGVVADAGAKDGAAAAGRNHVVGTAVVVVV